MRHTTGSFRAIRWDSLGAIELGNLGTDTSGRTMTLAYAINTTGTAVGVGQEHDGEDRWLGDHAHRCTSRLRGSGAGRAARS